MERGRGPKVLKSKSPSVPSVRKKLGSQLRIPRTTDILKSHLNTSLTLEKVHLVPVIYAHVYSYLRAQTISRSHKQSAQQPDQVKVSVIFADFKL